MMTKPTITRAVYSTSEKRSFLPRLRSDLRIQAIVFVLCTLAVIARRPDAVLNPGFYAEDGTTWYADAYNLGWLNALTLPSGGYLNTLQRLVAATSLLAPFHAVPLALNLAGVGLQVIPVSFLLSARCANWGSITLRLLYALTYIALPNSPEIHIVITNSQFHFALLAFLVVTAVPPATPWWRIFDLVVLSVVALTGPFCFVLLPIAVFLWTRSRSRWRLWTAAIVAALGCLQMIELLLAAHSQRPPVELGISFPLLIELLGGRVFLAPLGGSLGIRLPFALIVIFTVFALILLVYSCFRASLPLRLLVLFSFALLAAALARPLISGPTPAWQVLKEGGADRYWFFPTLAFLWCAVWCATSRVWLAARIIAICVLLMCVRGVRRDWRVRPLPDLRFQMYAARFEAMRPGDVIGIPVYPPGWTMQLKKH